MSASAAAGDVGHLAGTVRDYLTNTPIKRVTVRAYAHGRSVAHSALTEGDGSFRMEDLPAGAYAVCVPGSASHRPAVAPHVEIRPNATTPLKLQPTHSLNIDGDSWVQSAPLFSQTFTASGLGITGVRIKAFGGAKPIRMYWSRFSGTALGSARTTLPVGGEGTAYALWGGGEMSTQPTRQYRLTMNSPKGTTWVPAVAGRGDVYPGGQANFNDSPRPDSDLGILVMEDNDRMRTSYALHPGFREHRCVSAGQVFTALSRNITFASAHLAGIGATPTFVRFSIHEKGPGGKQIGPSKAVAPDDDAAVAWGPDEVPVEPRQLYYLHIEVFGDGRFLAACNEVSTGLGYFNGEPLTDRRLAATLCGDVTDGDFIRLATRFSSMHPAPPVNHSFEDGLSGWKRFGEGGAAVGVDDGVIPAWGDRMFGWTNKGQGQDTRVTIYQHVDVDVESGKQYTFFGSLYTDHIGGRSSDVKARMIVLPGGGDDVRNNDRMTSSQWYATEGRWCRGSVTFTPTVSPVTIGFELEQRWSLESSSVYVDGAYLAAPGH